MPQARPWAFWASAICFPLAGRARWSWHLESTRLMASKPWRSASDDCTARIWDALTGQPLTEPLKHNRHVHSAQFSPDGKKVVTVSEDNTARVWDAEIGQALNETLRHSDSIYLAQFSQDGKRVLTGSTDHSTRAWDAQTGKALTVSLKLDEQSLPWQFSPDGKRVVSASDKGARVWDALTGKALTESMEDNDLRTAEFSPDGKRLATTSANTARVWDALTGHALTAPLKHSEHVLSVQFSPDGKRVVTASLDKTAQVWDALTGQPLADPLKHGLMVRSAQFSPDGSRIATASWDRTARVWDARTSHALTDPMLHNDGVRSVQFGPDGKRIVTTSGNAARLWDAQTGQPLTQLLEHSGSVESAQFSPDGKWVVTASEDGTARVWDVLTGQALTEPLKHQQTVVSAQFNSDGTQLVTASDENKVRLWDIAPSATRCPDWLLMVAEAISGQVLNKNGVLEETKLDYQEALNRIRQELAQESAETGWGVWGRWFLADRATRTISPFSKITLPEYIEDRIRESTTESLDEAEHLALGDQNLQNRIGEAREARGRTDRAAELRRQADALAGRGKLSEAAADMAKAVELDPTDHWYWFVLAPLVVENGDVQGYHKLCQAMLARFGATNDPSIAERTAKVCLLLPVAVAELATASRLSELAVADGKDSPWLPYYQCTKGLSEYRQGRFTSAVDWVQKALASPGVIARDVQASMVLAMAQQQLNQPNEARATLAKGRELAETNLPKLDSGDLGPDWHDVLIANILMREAQGLIEGEKAAVKKSP